MTETYMTVKAAPKAWADTETGELVIRPAIDASVAIQAVGATSVEKAAMGYRTPIVANDPTATWGGEGTEIPVSKLGLAEVSDVFHRLAALTVVTRELIDDSDPQISNAAANALGRDIARKIDAAFFGKRPSGATAEDQPRGLGDIADVHNVAAGAKITSLDPFTDAIYAAASEGAVLSAFVANPDDALAIAKVKEKNDSNRTLLAPDPTQAGARTISGVPLLASPAVTKGTIWGLPKDRIVIAVRKDTELAVDESVFFTSYKVAMRAVTRVTYLYPHPAAIQKITIG